MKTNLKRNDQVILHSPCIGVPVGSSGTVIEVGSDNGIFGQQIKTKFVVGGVVVVKTFNTNNLLIRKMRSRF